MAFFKASTNEDALKENNFEYIDKSGIYDITIKFASVQVNKDNARSIDFNIDYKGSETTLYNLKLDNNDGSENFQRAIFNKLCIIAGIESVEEPVIQTHVVGKDRLVKEFSVLDQFSDMPVKVRIEFSYSLYNGEIKEQRNIKAFYRTDDGATASEIVHGTQPGVQLAKDLQRADTVSYRDGLTAEAVKTWKEAKASGKNESVPVKTSIATENPFAKK